MRKAFILFTLLLVYSAAADVFAQEQWELKKDESGIKVYTRRLADEKLKEIKVVAEMPGTPDQLVSIILDVANHDNWVYGIKETRLLKKASENSIIYYNVADLPWPVSDRDMVLHLTVNKDPTTKLTTIQSKSAKDYLPPQKGKIRVPYSKASWKITPLSKKSILAEYTFNVDPGGSLPSWLVNSVVTTGPYNTFVELQKIMATKNL